jgi:type IV pilus assembly protein PilY1
MTHLPAGFSRRVRSALLALVLVLLAPPLFGAPTDLNDIPMAVSNQVKANFLIVLDNSQSMDAYMGGALQSGDDPATRSNIGRDVLRDMLETYRTTFRWGLMSFDTHDPSFRDTHVYYMGNAETMNFTDDCGGRRCIANPQPFPGGKYVTYDVSSDDPDVLDALYDTESHAQLWGYSLDPGVSDSSRYAMWGSHVPGSGTAWAPWEFAGFAFSGAFTASDAGFLPATPRVTRLLFLPRGWGYRAPILGGGKLQVPVVADTTEHYQSLMSRLAPETKVESSEIKNAALYTPIAGTLDSVRSYFSGRDSPIEAWCQRNFVMQLTDGLPTGDKKGNLYSDAARTDTCSAWSDDKKTCTGTWTFGEAASDAFKSVTRLRSVRYSDAACVDCSSFDVQTYVIAMGDTVANARAVAVMNEMARLGSCARDSDGSCTDNGVQAFFASDKETLKNSVDQAISDAVAQDGAAAAVAVANANITETTSLYQSSYNSGNWSGDLESFKLDVTTGEPKGTRNWSAQEQLDKASADARRIASYDGSEGGKGGIQFRPSTAGTTKALSTAQEALISTTDAAGIIDYLRGDRSGETATPQKYRKRTHLLGDIVNAEPVRLGAPSASYSDTIDAGYADFKTAKAKRQAVVFQGANDGMLHVFNADDGNEEWAYVPGLLLPTLAALSRVHGFAHHYYVDGTPTVGDVDFARTAGSDAKSPDWRTLLVGGLGKGGYGFYALDVTTTTAADEAAAAAKVLWEFPNDTTSLQVVADLGYSFGRPVITKTASQGWVVLVSSGYNNTRTVERSGKTGSETRTGDGRGHLFVLNARTGGVIADITTGIGSTETPSGLAAFSAYIDNAAVDNTVTQVYGGDVLGNVWRFDLTGTPTDWNVKKLATLVDASGTPQPVTTAPELASIYESNAVYRFVYVGTGQYLGDSDVKTTQTQTMYGLVDNMTASPTIAPLRGDSGELQQQTLSAPVSVTDTAGNTTVQRTASAGKVVLAGAGKKRGWYIDLNVQGERVNTDPQLALGSLVFTSNIPSGELCVPGGSSYLNILDYRTGGALDASLLTWSSKFLGNALASRPVLVQLPSGKLRALIRLSSDKTIAEGVPVPLAKPPMRRVSWRELPER